MHEMAKLMFTLENDLRHALAEHQLRLHYQPIVSLQGREVIGYDALLRWEHPSSGMMLPDAFLKVAEDSGLMVPIGRWVLAEACHHHRQRQRGGQPDGTLFVNVKLTARQFGHPELVDEVREALDTCGLAPRSLMLGLRESVLAANPGRAYEVIAGLRELDVQLCLDDFGVGYSSLPHLDPTSFNTVKVSRSFLDNIGDDADRWRIVDVLLRIGSHLGIRVVAKGIESEDQLARLLDIGYQYGQGHLLGQPAPPATSDDAPPPSQASPAKVKFRIRSNE
jgi:EAL domain-containing protein (putative c-di-GMP-specific phosphodiesterase class I)